MERIRNKQAIEEFVQLNEQLKDLLAIMTEEMYWYLDDFKDEQFIPEENENKEHALTRAENLFDKIQQLFDRRENVKKDIDEMIRLFEEMKGRTEAINSIYDEDELCNRNNETIDKIIELRREIMERNIQNDQQRENEYRIDFEKNRDILMTEKRESIKARTARLQREQRER